MRVLVKHFFLALLEELDGLLALPHQVDDEYVEVLVAVQLCHVVLVLGIDQPQSLVGVGQDVQDERGRVLQVHLLVLAQLHHLVHQFPCFIEGALVGRALRMRDRVRESALQLRKYRKMPVLLDGTVPTCHFERYGRSQAGTNTAISACKYESSALDVNTVNNYRTHFNIVKGPLTQPLAFQQRLSRRESLIVPLIRLTFHFVGVILAIV